MVVKRVLDDTFLKTFSGRYQQLKDCGMIPIAIAKQMSEECDCGKTTYYYYLRHARAKGFIADSYEENMIARREREARIRQMTKTNINESIEETLEHAVYGVDLSNEGDHTTSHTITIPASIEDESKENDQQNKIETKNMEENKSEEHINTEVTKPQKKSFFARIFGKK
jgi:hypothetical protein